MIVVGVTRVPGVHRVYNMTVEGEHVYHVSTFGALAHNLGCAASGGQSVGGAIKSVTGEIEEVNGQITAIRFEMLSFPEEAATWASNLEQAEARLAVLREALSYLSCL